jgi:hypothetical protein
MNARNNTNLIVLPKVVLTPIIEPVIVQLDAKYREAGLIAYVTSGLRTPLNQLQIIQDYLVQKGIAKFYPVCMSCKVDDTMTWEGRTVYNWQPAWSKLLSIGLIINPPKKAMCLMDSFRKDGSNRKGQLINPSPHFKGGSFDVGGGDNGIADETKVTAPWVGVLPGLSYILPERENNCLHHDCVKV